ncbi:MAG: type II/IV secretion system ATPase subunit [Thermofilaceae archaeon]
MSAQAIEKEAGGGKAKKEKVKSQNKKAKKERSKKKVEEKTGEEKAGDGVSFLPLKEHYKILEEYWVAEPYAKVKIAEIPELGNQRMYFVEEVQLAKGEKSVLGKLIDILAVELEPPASFDVDLREHIVKEARRLAEKYRAVARGLSEESWNRVLYYVERDLVGYGPIEVLMRDYKLEDVSCDGVDRPIHVWHRDYESIPTNIVFRDRDTLREFIVKITHMSGKHISAAFPIVDAMLPGRHRLAATYGEEVSPKGSTFTIRKFRERPFSVVELVETGNIDSWTAAYLWLMIENKMTVMVIGATAAGKTTFLNAIANFFKPGFKIVTIEETPELNLPHENWVQLVSRESYGLGESKVGEISLYDLVRLSLRYRPDYIIVGEVRGSEAFVLFQAMATGHGGMSTMHADSLEAAVRRLTSPPMNVAPAYIPALNVACYVERTILPDGRVGRRMRHLWEVEDYQKYREIVRWDPVRDTHVVVGGSTHAGFVATRLGKSVDEVFEEIERRRQVLEWLKMKGVKDTKDVFIWINRYYMNPKEVYELARSELEQLKVKPAPPIVAPSAPSAHVPVVAPSAAAQVAQPIARPVLAKQTSEVDPLQALRSLPRAIQVRRGAAASEPIMISKEALTVLKALGGLGGVADRETLRSSAGLAYNVYTKAISELAQRRLVEIAVSYSGGSPKVSYRLTELGERQLEALPPE